jgi:UDP-2,4-diacetamido-2,4,6-trideoxy-beta-L-altropyranose hydrolase
MNRGSILLRVDGSAQDGMGRMARCLALANALQRRRYQMTFLSQIDNSSWPDRIRRFRHGIVRTPFAAGSEQDRAEVLQEVDRKNPVVFITDSPAIDEEYLAMLATRVPLLISLDESAEHRFPSDLVLNPTLGKSTPDYTLYPGTQLVAGDKYAMIRSEFRRARGVRATEPGGPTRILLALGGGDTAAATFRFAKALLQHKGIAKIDAVLGAGKQDRKQLDELAAEHSDRLSVSADVRDLATRMTKAHLLVTGGGVTSLEAACVGIPTVIVTHHRHHEMNATWLEEIGVAHYLGHEENVTGEQVLGAAVEILEDNFERKAMSRSGRMLIDGRGADRIVTATEILLRRARSRARTVAA